MSLQYHFKQFPRNIILLNHIPLINKSFSFNILESSCMISSKPCSKSTWSIATLTKICSFHHRRTTTKNRNVHFYIALNIASIMSNIMFTSEIDKYLQSNFDSTIQKEDRNI